MSFAQIGNVVTIQAASVQEQLQRIQQLREQQQQKKKQAAEAKREQALNAASQSDIIQKQVRAWVRACVCVRCACVCSSIPGEGSLSSCHQYITSPQSGFIFSFNLSLFLGLNADTTVHVCFLSFNDNGFP